jgi:hypothetical protein
MATPNAPRFHRDVPVVEKELEIMSGWKDIANYLGKGVRTVQRYERALGLPIRRPGKASGYVMATKAELDAWTVASSDRQAFQPPNSVEENAALMNEFRHRITELHRLRQESAHLREALHEAVELLRVNVNYSLSQRDGLPRASLVRNAFADVLLLNSAKRA